MKTKRSLLLLFFSTAIALNGFTADDPLKARFFYSGDKGLSPKTCVYKIDNQTKPDFIKGYLPFAYNKTHKIGGFDLELDPGSHTFEIVFNDKSTMSKKSENIVAKKFTLKMEAGNSYVLERKDFEFDIICESKSGKTKADFTIEDVAIYAEPSQGQPFAALSYTHEKKAEVDPYISRIDDQMTNGFGELYGVCNYALPVDFKYFSGTKGALNLKVSPGVHKIEYVILGEYVVDGLVHIESFNFEAGKSYKIEVEEIKPKNSSLSSAKIRIIEE